MILDMLKKRDVQILDHVDDWKEAITVSLRSLEEQGYVTPGYAKGTSTSQMRWVHIMY